MSAEVLDDRVPYCVVKRNCNGPSFLVEGSESRGTKQRWVCHHCFGFVLTPNGQVPEKGKKVEP